MKEINVNNMVQGIKQNMSTIRYIRILFIMLALFMGTASEAWAYTKLDPVNGVTVYLERTPSNTGGTIAVSDVSAVTGGKKVTLTITPSTGYSISKDLITAVAVKNISSTRTGTPDLMENPLPITDEGDNKYSFVLPAIYTATYVTVTFKQGTIYDNVTLIRSLSEITDPTKKYEMVADIDASGFDGFDFKDADNNPLPFSGTLDGGFYKIKRLSKPLFTTIDGGTVKNVIFEGVNISSGDNDGDAGAVTSKAKGATRIYNCGILPTSVERNDKGEITGFYGCNVGGSGNVGGLVGTLSGTARVINCYSYANIRGGANKGGIVGSNEETSTQVSLTTMVMNCLFYGEISNGENVSPIYGGIEINNVEGGLNNYNYYRYNSSYSKNKQINKYNRALAMEEKFINRFERYRLLLNSNKKLAAKYTSTATVTVEPNDMAKWVLETADRSISGRDPYPYPVLKAQGYYPSIINPDIEHAPDCASVGRNHGGKLGKTLIVHIAGVGSNAPDGAKILRRGPITLQRTDKDTTRFNFNYDKVQLPYYPF